MRTLFELEKENIKNKKQVERRNRELQKIFSLDRKLEQMANAKHQEELQSLYPHRENSEGTCVPGDINVSSNSSLDMSRGMSDSINRKVSWRVWYNQILLNKFNTSKVLYKQSHFYNLWGLTICKQDIQLIHWLPVLLEEVAGSNDWIRRLVLPKMYCRRQTLVISLVWI